MTTGPIVENEGVTAATARTLQLVAFAMAAGNAAFAAIAVWLHFTAEAKVPTPDAVKLINTLTSANMGMTVAMIIVSEAAWRHLLRDASQTLNARVQTAAIVRIAAREGASMLGAAVVLIAALNGILRVYPAYWVNLAPFALFIGFLAAHFPSAEKLTAEARGVLK